ncbi:PepSY-like domain-containing protein [Roseivirga seohaensis]|nr:PepSY-like domain-containing protein [Roseivirga seohaensis]
MEHIKSHSIYKFFERIYRPELMILLYFFYLTACAPSNGNKGKFDEAVETFQRQYPNGKDTDWEEDDKGNLEVNFKLKGEKYRADYDLNGNWIETEKSVKWSDLPSVVQNKIEEEYDKDDITEIEWVDHKTKGKFYDVEFKRKGKNMDVEYSLSGQKIME